MRKCIIHIPFQDYAGATAKPGKGQGKSYTIFSTLESLIKNVRILSPDRTFKMSKNIEKDAQNREKVQYLSNR